LTPVVDAFEPDEQIGQGSLGAVYRAVRKEDRLAVAMKVIDLDADLESAEGGDEVDAYVAETLEEIRVLKHVSDSPNITSFYAAYYAEQQLYICLELADGGALGDFTEGLGRGFTEAELAGTARGVLAALTFCHRRGVVHRDVKGENILTDTEGVIKLTDFGVAYAAATPPAAGSPVDCSADSIVVGSPYWMAPELITAKSTGKPYTSRIDVWSFGVVLIELADMAPPYAEFDRPWKVMNMVRSKAPPTLANPAKYSDSLNALIAACLVKDPASRPDPWDLQDHAFLQEHADDKGAAVQAISREFHKACLQYLPERRQVTPEEKEAIKDKFEKKLGFRPDTTMLGLEVVRRVADGHDARSNHRQAAEALSEASKAAKVLGLEVKHEDLEEGLGVSGNDARVIVNKTRSSLLGVGLQRADKTLARFKNISRAGHRVKISLAR